MSKLSNGWNIPTEINKMQEMLDDFQRNLKEMEKDNPLTIFRENMESGLLYKASLQDALNQLNTYTSLYISAVELSEIIFKKKKDIK